MQLTALRRRLTKVERNQAELQRTCDRFGEQIARYRIAATGLAAISGSILLWFGPSWIGWTQFLTFHHRNGIELFAVTAWCAGWAVVGDPTGRSRRLIALAITVAGGLAGIID